MSYNLKDQFYFIIKSSNNNKFYFYINKFDNEIK